MFDIGWTEMLVIAVVMIVVVGPKDLPKMLRTFGKTTAKLRAMAGDFQKQFNEALREAELEDVKKSVDSLRSLSPAAEVKKQLNPFQKAAEDVRSGLDTMMRPQPKPNAAGAAEAIVAAEPLKNGNVEMPGPAAAQVPGPEVMPEPAIFPAMPDPAPVAAPNVVETPQLAAYPPKRGRRTAAAPSDQSTKPKAAKTRAASGARKAAERAS